MDRMASFSNDSAKIMKANKEMIKDLERQKYGKNHERFKSNVAKSIHKHNLLEGLKR